MNSNDFQRGNITLSLNDPLDYEGFKQACEKEGVEPLSPVEYVQKVLWLFAGMKLWPEKEPRDAYLEFVARKGKIEEIVYIPIARAEGEKKEGCCGGKAKVDDGSIPPPEEMATKEARLPAGGVPHHSTVSHPVSRPGCGKCGGGKTR